MLNLKNKDVIAVGDSDNDLPLFETASFKVAMANGTENIKKAADYIAPPIQKDGLVDVIEKFILINQNDKK